MENIEKVKKNKSNEDSNLVKLSAMSVCAVIAIILLLMSFYNVDTGQVAIIKRFGKVISIKEEGLNFKIPLIDNYKER